MNNVIIYTDNDFSSPLKGFSPMRVKVRKGSRVIGAPIEKGRMSFDNKVIDPITITIDGYVDCSSDEYNDCVAKINKMVINRKFSFYSLSTKDQSYDSMILQECPITEETEKFDLAMYSLTFVEALVVQGGNKGGSANSENDAMTNCGYSAPKSELLGAPL